MSEISVGIDISKSKFDVAILFSNGKVKTKKFENKPSGFADLVEWLGKHEASNPHICLEATGIYGEALATYLFELGYRVSVVNPAQVKGFAQCELLRTKTDKVDGQLIGRFCRAIHPPLWQPKPQHIRELQAWVRRLEGLQVLYQQEANRLESAPACVQSSLETIKKSLEEELERTKKVIKEHIELHADLRDKRQLLKTIPGVGEATIAQILAFIGNVEDFKNAKQLAAFIGLNPKQRQSGSSVLGRTRLSKIGDAHLRKAFYMPTLVARRCNPIIKHFCKRLEAAGKPVMLVIGAAMRKLVHIIYGILKSGKPFNVSLAMA